MATITSNLASARGNTQRGRNVYLVQNELDFAVTTVDPSAADVVQMMTIPAGTAVLAAGVEVMTAVAGAGSDCTIDLGFSSIDADGWVDGFDLDAASAGDYASQAASVATEFKGLPAILTADDTLDLTFAGTDGGIASGKVRVFALCMDISDTGDMSADEVDRDTLA